MPSVTGAAGMCFTFQMSYLFNSVTYSVYRQKNTKEKFFLKDKRSIWVLYFVYFRSYLFSAGKIAKIVNFSITFIHWFLSSKFIDDAINYQDVPPHLKCVHTLLCESWKNDTEWFLSSKFVYLFSTFTRKSVYAFKARLYILLCVIG